MAWAQRFYLRFLPYFSQPKPNPRRPTAKRTHPEQATQTTRTKKAIKPNPKIMQIPPFNVPVEMMDNSQIWVAKIGATVAILLYAVPLFVFWGVRIVLYFHSREALLYSNGCWRKAKKPNRNNRFKRPKIPFIFKS
jgi:hypothetical protein